MTQIKVADGLQNVLEASLEKETLHSPCSQPPGQLQKGKEHGVFTRGSPALECSPLTPPKLWWGCGEGNNPSLIRLSPAAHTWLAMPSSLLAWGLGDRKMVRKERKKVLIHVFINYLWCDRHCSVECEDESDTAVTDLKGWLTLWQRSALATFHLSLLTHQLPTSVSQKTEHHGLFEQVCLPSALFLVQLMGKLAKRQWIESGEKLGNIYSPGSLHA